MKQNEISQKQQALYLILTSSEEPLYRKLSETQINQFVEYYRLVLSWNDLLHLTTITEPLDFLQKHLYESLFVADYLNTSIKNFWDFGTGLGIPGLPLAVFCRELRFNLVEVNKKKAIFLRELKDRLVLNNVRVVNSRFQDVIIDKYPTGILTRAIEDLSLKAFDIIKSNDQVNQFLFLGNKDLSELLLTKYHSKLAVLSIHIPGTEQRYLIDIRRFT